MRLWNRRVVLYDESVGGTILCGQQRTWGTGMPAKEKVLWVVGYDILDRFLDQAGAVGATAVAIRTDNNIAKAIPAFHDRGIKVYGWRWPSAQRDPAMHEADRAADLFAAGLDGYFVDPEGAKGQPYDWDQPGLEQLADDFCSRITGAAGAKPFGTTSHYRAASVFPHLPWKTFFKYSTVLLPQAYWKSTSGIIGHGLPADNYDVAIQFWSKAGGEPGRIIPMGGELGSSDPSEVDAHANQAAKNGIRSIHFYSWQNDVSQPVWQAVAAA